MGNAGAFLGLAEESAAPPAESAGALMSPPRPPRVPVTPVDNEVLRMRTMITDVTHEIARDRRKMERAENGAIMKMKLAAEKGNKGETHRIAKSMVQSRRHAMGVRAVPGHGGAQALGEVHVLVHAADRTRRRSSSDGIALSGLIRSGTRLLGSPRRALPSTH